MSGAGHEFAGALLPTELTMRPTLAHRHSPTKRNRDDWTASAGVPGRHGPRTSLSPQQGSEASLTRGPRSDTRRETGATIVRNRTIEHAGAISRGTRARRSHLRLQSSFEAHPRPWAAEILAGMLPLVPGLAQLLAPPPHPPWSGPLEPTPAEPELLLHDTGRARSTPARTGLEQDIQARHITGSRRPRPASTPLPSTPRPCHG